MKIDAQREETILQNIDDGESFGLTNVAMAAHVLSSNIYSFHRRQEAVLRELSTNASDSHIEAGFPDKPIKVHLPTLAEPYLYVEDNGIGLLAPEVEDLFGNYFRSLSNQRKKANGFFGVGSKSPYAYASVYTVESFKDGNHCIYQFYKDEENKPRFTPILNKKTDRANGLIIKMPVQNADIDIFEREAIKLYQNFDVMPVFIGKDISEKIKDLKATVNSIISKKGNGWRYINVYTDSAKKTFSSAYNHADHNTIILGGVSYPLCFKTLKESPWYGLSDLNLDHLDGLILDLDVEKEPINIDTGREKLQYTQTTCKVIENKIREIVSYGRKHLSKISKSMSDWQIMQYINDQMRGNKVMMLAMNKLHKSILDYNDINPIGVSVKLLTHDKLMRVCTAKLCPENKGNKSTIFTRIRPSHSVHVVVKNSRKMNRDALSTYMYTQNVNLMVIEGESGSAISLDQAKDVLRNLGNPPILSEDEIIEINLEKTKEHKLMIERAQAIPLLEKIRHINKSRWNSFYADKIEANDLFDQLKFAMENNTPVHYHLKKTKKVDEMIDDDSLAIAVELNLVSEDKEKFSGLISLDSKTLEVLTYFSCLVNIEDKLTEISEDRNHQQHKQMVRAIAKRAIGTYTVWDKTRLQHYKYLSNSLKTLFPSDGWKFMALDRLIKIQYHLKKDSFYRSNSKMGKFKTAFEEATDVCDSLKQRITPLINLFSMYPMLEFIEHKTGSADREKQYSAIREYVLLKNAQSETMMNESINSKAA